MIHVSASCRGEDLRSGNLDGVERTFDFAFPEFEEFMKLGKGRGQIQRLPHIGLEQVKMIRQAVDNFRRGQTVPVQLTFDLCHADKSPLLRTRKFCPILD
jgi:hypothetical protein